MLQRPSMKKCQGEKKIIIAWSHRDRHRGGHETGSLWWDIRFLTACLEIRTWTHDCPARVVEWNKEHMSKWTNKLSTTWKIKWTAAS